jgi:predicted transglutaminase-like cysteine proteinase
VQYSEAVFNSGIFVALSCPGHADPVEPFGIHTVAIHTGFFANVGRWLKRRLYSADLGTIASCGPSRTEECAAASELLTVVKQARQYQGKAFLAHLNRSINLLIKSGPGKWTSALDALESGVGDCKAYAVTKYVALLVAGIQPEHIRLVAVHKRQGNEDQRLIQEINVSEQ